MTQRTNSAHEIAANVTAGRTTAVETAKAALGRIESAKALNAVVTATEAKTQVLLEHGVPGTGTASDAVCVLFPPVGEEERFAGPRSVWGARVARAVHRAVTQAMP